MKRFLLISLLGLMTTQAYASTCSGYLEYLEIQARDGDSINFVSFNFTSEDHAVFSGVYGVDRTQTEVELNFDKSEDRWILAEILDPNDVSEENGNFFAITKSGNENEIQVMYSYNGDLADSFLAFGTVFCRD